MWTLRCGRRKGEVWARARCWCMRREAWRVGMLVFYGAACLDELEMASRGSGTVTRDENRSRSDLGFRGIAGLVVHWQ